MATPPPGPVRVVHWARTALATAAIARAMDRPGVDFRRVDDFVALMAEAAAADLILLTDPGPDLAARLCARLETLCPRPVALHLLSAGREGFAGWIPPPHVALSSVGGALAPTVAEHALALLLALRRGLGRFAAADCWTPDTTAAAWVGSLEGGQLLVVGCGRIGREIARRARPFGLHVTGLNRGPVAPGDFDATHPLDTIDTHLPQTDAVVLCLPLAPGTAGLMGPDRIARLRRGAILINVGRGGLVDESALAAALSAGHLGGAGLDVFATEPLPASSPLWQAPNTILTPHVAGLGGKGEARIAASALEALARIRPGAATDEPGRD